MKSAGLTRAKIYCEVGNMWDSDNEGRNSGKDIGNPVDQDFISNSISYATPVSLQKKGKAIRASVSVRKSPKASTKDTTLYLSLIHPQYKSESVLSINGIQEIYGRAILQVQTHGP